jgi:predicted RNA-binding protein YlqC (UPF0109 family)
VSEQSTNVSMKDLVEFISKALVDETSRIEISEIEGNQTNIIELKVAKEDIGKVIGRQGRTADAIRTIINCAAAKLSKRYILQIIDE